MCSIKRIALVALLAPLGLISPSCPHQRVFGARSLVLLRLMIVHFLQKVLVCHPIRPRDFVAEQFFECAKGPGLLRWCPARAGCTLRPSRSEKAEARRGDFDQEPLMSIRKACPMRRKDGGIFPFYFAVRQVCQPRRISCRKLRAAGLVVSSLRVKCMRS